MANRPTLSLILPPLFDVAATRAAESASGIAPAELMERAGALAAGAVLAVFAPRAAVVACGTGNNGGDGYVVARHLAAAGVSVTVAATGDPTSATAAVMRARWAGEVVPLASAEPCALLIDAVVGIGCTRPLAALNDLARLAATARIVAIDVPSGLDADTGSGDSLIADLTIACGTLKPAHLLAAARCGRVVVADLGFDTRAATLLATARPPPLTPSDDAHKYARGAVFTLGGKPGFGGAARLAATAAVRAGAGLALIACPAAALTENAARLDAVMVRTADDGPAVTALLTQHRFAATIVGPGLENDADRIAAVLASGLPVVLDAGVFTAFADAPDRLAAALTGPAVLTPHDGEFVRLFGALPGDRLAQTRAAAARVRAVVVRKGPATIIAAPDGRAAINAHATPWLATAGSGDVLAGVIAALLAQGFDAFDAACAGVWLHGDAGQRAGPGMTADDLPAAVGWAVAAL
jgi:hydroxyethylthiazole kinase-like uncharacterized protein yjeF